MKIEDILEKLNVFEDENERILKDYFKDKTSLEIIEEITKNKYKTKKCYIAIKTLLKNIDNIDNYSIIFNISKNIIENYDIKFLELFIANIYNKIDINEMISILKNNNLDSNISNQIEKIIKNIDKTNLKEKEEKYFGLSFEFDFQKSETYYLNQILGKLSNNELENYNMIKNEFKSYFPYKHQSTDNIIDVLLYNEELEEIKVYIAIKSLLNNCDDFNKSFLFTIINHINNLKNEELAKLLVFHLLNNNIIDENILKINNLNSRGEIIFKSVYDEFKDSTKEENAKFLLKLETEFIKNLNLIVDTKYIDINNTLNKITTNIKNNIEILNEELMKKYKLNYCDLIYLISEKKYNQKNAYLAIKTLLYYSNMNKLNVDPYKIISLLTKHDYTYDFIFLIILNLKKYKFFGYEYDKNKIFDILNTRFSNIISEENIMSLDIIANYNEFALRHTIDDLESRKLNRSNWDALINKKVNNNSKNNINMKELYDKITDDTQNNYKIIKEYTNLKNDYEIISKLFYYNINEVKCYKAIKSIIKESNNLEFKNIKKEMLSYLYDNNQRMFDLLMLEFYIKYYNGYEFMDFDFQNYLQNTSYGNHLVVSIIPSFNKLNKNEKENMIYEMEKRYINFIQNKQEKKDTETNIVVLNDKGLKLTKEDIKKIEKYGTLLNLKEYKTNVAVGREREIKSLIITLAQDKTSPIIVGESGTGKTALVEEIAYRIQKGDVPDFLLNQLILEVSPAEIVAGCKYVGMFEQNMKELLDICKKYKILLFIDEIHEMYGTGSGEKKEVDMADIIKRYISRDNGKIIGTTTNEEYQKYFSSDALKRRFDKIEIKEPSKTVLHEIIDKVMDDFSNKNNIYFESEKTKEEIINIIIEATSKLKPYNDRLCNPDLSIKIIDKAYAYAKVDNSNEIRKENFISSFEDTKWLYESTIKSAIMKLENIREEKEIKEEKCLILNFNDYLK